MDLLATILRIFQRWSPGEGPREAGPTLKKNETKIEKGRKSLVRCKADKNGEDFLRKKHLEIQSMMQIWPKQLIVKLVQLIAQAFA